MSRAGWTTVGVLLILLGGLAVVSWSSNLDREESSQTFQGVTEFVFELENSPVEIVAGGDEAVVDMSVTTGFLSGSVELDQSGETLRLVQDCPFFNFGWGCRGSFVVTVPPASTVSGDNSNGTISLTGLDGAVEVVTSNGAVSIDDVSSDVTIHTSNGPVSGADLASPRFEASTSNGRIDVIFIESPMQVALDSNNGDIDLVLPSDAPPYAMRTSTSNGEVITEVRTDPAASETIDIETSNGDITVRYSG